MCSATIRTMNARAQSHCNEITKICAQSIHQAIDKINANDHRCDFREYFDKQPDPDFHVDMDEDWDENMFEAAKDNMHFIEKAHENCVELYKAVVWAARHMVTQRVRQQVDTTKWTQAIQKAVAVMNSHLRFIRGEKDKIDALHRRGVELGNNTVAYDDMDPWVEWDVQHVRIINDYVRNIEGFITKIGTYAA